MNKNIICLIDINHNEYSVKSWTEYAKKIDCELFVIDQKLFDENYMPYDWYVIYVLDILDQNDISYDQVLCVNNNTLVHPNADNIFNLTNNKFTAVRRYGDIEIVLSSIEIFSNYFNNFLFPYYKYLDTNMLVFNKTHSQTLKNIQEFYYSNIDLINSLQDKFHLQSSSAILNFFFNKEIEDFTILGYEWNMQDMMRYEVITNDLLHTKYGFISQYNNIGNDVMEYTCKHIY